jgi:hypothetical protein
MTRTAIFLAAVLPFLVVGSARAQKLEPGTWTGSVTPPNEEQALPVTYDVAMKGDTIVVTVDAGEHGTFPFSDVKLTGGELTFWFMPGTRVDCTLARGADGAFQGSCRDADGGTARMVMVPPDKG